MLVVTTTSKLCGSRMSRMAMVSTMTSSTVDVRELLGDPVAFLHEHAAAELEDGVLVHDRQPLLALAARSRGRHGRPATSPPRVMTRTEIVTSSVGRNSPEPATTLRSG